MFDKYGVAAWAVCIYLIVVSDIIIIGSCRAQALPAISGVQFSDSLKSPIGAVLRSFFIPGWGQWYNGKKLKSIGAFCAEGTMFYYAVRETRRYNKYGDTDSHKRRNTLYWWSFFFHLVSITDAYVDAYLDRFNENMHITCDTHGVYFSVSVPIDR